MEDVGAAFQALAEFPEGVNVEFVRVRSDGGLDQRTYERGSGETLACGSGATAVAVAAWASGRIATDSVRVHLRGGVLVVRRDGSRVLMEGPARTVFTGVLQWRRAVGRHGRRRAIARGFSPRVSNARGPNPGRSASSLT